MYVHSNDISTDPSVLRTWSIVSPETVPVPLPTPLAVKVVPTVLLAAPIEVKEVVQTDRIVYVLPALIDVATIDEGNVGDVGVKPLLSLLVLKLVATVLPALA